MRIIETKSATNFTNSNSSNGWAAENLHPTWFVKFGALLSFLMGAFAITYDRTYTQELM